jgi:hypothetical protein
MVAVREARKAFRRYHLTCFWSAPADLVVGITDIAWLADGLRKRGDRAAWRVAARLEQLAQPASEPSCP